MSFTLAAAELNVTQTAISHQIRRLEEQLGMPLFIRRNRGLVLTQEAQDYSAFYPLGLRGSAPGDRKAAAFQP